MGGALLSAHESRALFLSGDVDALRRLPRQRATSAGRGSGDRFEPLSDLPGAWIEVPESTGLVLRTATTSGGRAILTEWAGRSALRSNQPNRREGDWRQARAAARTGSTDQGQIRGDVGSAESADRLGCRLVSLRALPTLAVVCAIRPTALASVYALLSSTPERPLAAYTVVARRSAIAGAIVVLVLPRNRLETEPRR